MADPPATAHRALAGGAAALVAGGVLAMAAAVLAGPGAGVAGYVSEAGTGTYPLAATYRSGVLSLAVGVVLLAAALAPLSAVAGALLLLAAGAAGLSGAVPCSDGCPLPPFQAATGADLVHGGASIVGVAACVFAMVAVAAAPACGRVQRRLAATAAAVTLPLSAAMALAMLFAGRGALTGGVERALLLTAAAWLVAAATLRTRAGGRQSARTTMDPDTTNVPDERSPAGPFQDGTAATWRNHG